MHFGLTWVYWVWRNLKKSLWQWNKKLQEEGRRILTFFSSIYRKKKFFIWWRNPNRKCPFAGCCCWRSPDGPELPRSSKTGRTFSRMGFAACCCDYLLWMDLICLVQIEGEGGVRRGRMCDYPHRAGPKVLFFSLLNQSRLFFLLSYSLIFTDFFKYIKRMISCRWWGNFVLLALLWPHFCCASWTSLSSSPFLSRQDGGVLPGAPQLLRHSRSLRKVHGPGRAGGAGLHQKQTEWVCETPQSKTAVSRDLLVKLKHSSA